MSYLFSLLLCFCITFSQMTPFAPLAYNGWESTQISLEDILNKDSVSDNTVPVETTQQEEVQEVVDDYNIGNYMSLDLEGYCTLEVPQSHFQLNSQKSTATTKHVLYKDNKSRIQMSYITDMGSDTDIPGYITREVCGIETTTNNKYEDTYGENVWMTVPSENKIEGNNAYVIYLLSDDKSSAVWCKITVNPDTDSAEFWQSVEKIMTNTDVYSLGKTVFETPTTGYWASINGNTDETKADTSTYKANDKANTVFQTRGGYVPGADISSDWTDMEIIIDGCKYKLPCKLADFYETGYKVKDNSLTDEQISNYQVRKNSSIDIPMINNKGTVVTLTVYNDSTMESRLADECTVGTLVMDSTKFISVASTDVDETTTPVENTETETAEASTEDEPVEEDTSDSETMIVDGEEVAVVTPPSEVETDDSETEAVEDTEEVVEERDINKEIEQKFGQPSSLYQEIHVEDYEHEMILAGGVTWGVYTDDLIAYLGSNCRKVKASNDCYVCTWTNSNLSMKIKIGLLKDINYVRLSTVSED